MKNSFLLLLTIFVFSACNTYSDDQINLFDTQISSYLRKKKIKCKRSESGLYYSISKPGEGDYIQFTDQVSFSYKGTLLDGTVFDNRKTPITFAVKDLIAGWKEIMPQLKSGAEVFLVIPPHLGYGDHDLEKIPPNSILLFNMKIASIN